MAAAPTLLLLSTTALMLPPLRPHYLRRPLPLDAAAATRRLPHRFTLPAASGSAPDASDPTPPDDADTAMREDESFTAAMSKDDLPSEDLDPLSKEMYDEINARATKDFNEELYRHLEKREEYIDSNIYKGLRSRVDVEEPLSGIFEENKNRDRKPDPVLTPTEVIDLVLVALREKREEGDYSGVELLQRFMGPGSSIHKGTDVSAPMLASYFADSKYIILLEWVTVQYLRKLELSLDKKRARQQLRLKNDAGTWVPVTFQLSKHDTDVGSVWLIEQVMVKSDDADLPIAADADAADE